MDNARRLPPTAERNASSNDTPLMVQSVVPPGQVRVQVPTQPNAASDQTSVPDRITAYGGGGASLVESGSCTRML